MKKLISIITPVHNEEQNIPHFHATLTKELKDVDYNFEVIYVDDGSKDKSIDAIHALKPTKKMMIRMIELSRNFGKEIAITSGLHAAKGDAAILIDSDLQHPIDRIPQFIESWETGDDIVIGVRSTHAKDSKIKVFGSRVYYRLMNYISETKVVPHSTDFRLLDRSVIDAFSRFTERQRMTRGLIDWLGFKRSYIYFDALERQFGSPSYSIQKLFRLAVNSFTANSLIPLRFAGYLGSFITILSGIAGIFILIERFIMGDPLKLGITGTAVLAVLLVFLIGIVLVSLGLIALYIANIHGEVVNRPLYVVRREKQL